FFFNDTATTEIYTLSLHDALPILLLSRRRGGQRVRRLVGAGPRRRPRAARRPDRPRGGRGRLDAPGRDLPGEQGEHPPPSRVRLPARRRARAPRRAERRVAGRVVARTTVGGDGMTKVEAVVIRERIETVIDAVEEETGHVGVTVIEAVGHGRQRGVTHEYRGRVFESRFLPKAMLIFLVADEKVDAVVK